MPASTPIARSKSAALTRILDLVPRGYTRYVQGTVTASKAARLAEKFHQKYGIGCTPAQRITRKRKDLANTALILYWPANSEVVTWVLLATDGNGLDDETWISVTDRRRLTFLGYELVRRSNRGKVTWTWKRPRQFMASLYTELSDLLRRRHHSAVAELLERLARQPGFHGIRKQSTELFQQARKKGYVGTVPKLYYLRKVSHGERLALVDACL